MLAETFVMLKVLDTCPSSLLPSMSFVLFKLAERDSTCSLVDGCSTLIKKKNNNSELQNKYIVAKCDFKRHKERNMSYSLNHPPRVPFTE